MRHSLIQNLGVSLIIHLCLSATKWISPNHRKQSGVVSCAAPPHPDFTSWESVHAMRRRLNATFDYRTKYIHPELCRYMNEEECKELDRKQQVAIEQHEYRTIQRNRQRMMDATFIDTTSQNQISSKNLPKTTGMKEKVNSHYRQSRRLAIPNQGNVQVLVLLIRFKGHETRNVPTRDYFDELFNGNGVSATNPIGSIRQYYRYGSLGIYNVTFHIEDWYQLDKTEAECSGGASGFVAASVLEQIWLPKLNALDSAGFDWSKYDLNGFKVLNQLGIITSGYPAEFGDPPSNCSDNTAANRIWSQASPAAGTTWQSTTGYTFSTYFLSGAFFSPLCAFVPAHMNQFTHEFLHGFGLLDMYDTDTTGDTYIRPGGTGAYDIMGYTYGWVDSGVSPPHMTPTDRVQTGWLNAIDITEDGSYAIQASEISGQIYTISMPYPSNEYLVIENRQPMMWDVNMPGGIVIYHVDTSKTANDERGYPGHANWPSEHYQVAVQQADGRYDLEKGVNAGDATDFWLEGMTFGPGDMNGSTTVWPNTDSYTTGRTGVKITVTSPSRFIMTFNVSGVGTTLRSANITRAADLDPRSTKSTVNWILSMLIGSAALIGVVFLLLL